MAIKRLIIILAILVSNIIWAQSEPYVLLISFDGFRWDYLERGITPNLNQLIESGVRAKSLKPCFPSKTFPNHISIITGMYPENHGIISNNFLNQRKERYKLSSVQAVQNPEWYLGEAFWETAERNNITTASFFWPGSELTADYRRPSYYMNYKHTMPYKERVKGVIDWLKIPYPERPHFITLYFHDTDSYAHDFGPNSPELNNSIKRLDDVFGFLLSELENTDLRDSLNIIILSDHGMTEISKTRLINVDKIIDTDEYVMEGTGPFTMFNSTNNKANLYKQLKDKENHYRVYLKEEMPEYFHYSRHPFLYDIIMVADLGWQITNDKQINYKKHYYKGDHGYDNNELDMHGIFIAGGPNFKVGLKTGTIENIDIYPLLCKIFNISPRSNIDGKLERIEFLLKD